RSSAQVASGESLRRYQASAQKVTPMLRSGAVAALRQHLQGPLVSPDDADYNTARKVWNGQIDRRPALVTFCADEADVVAARVIDVLDREIQLVLVPFGIATELAAAVGQHAQELDSCCARAASGHAAAAPPSSVMNSRRFTRSPRRRRRANPAARSGRGP